jgi:hypothetical protein
MAYRRPALRPDASAAWSSPSDFRETERIEACAVAYPGAGQRMGKGQHAAGQGGAAARAYASRTLRCTCAAARVGRPCMRR